jgi:hypothetical protein
MRQLGLGNLLVLYTYTVGTARIPSQSKRGRLFFAGRLLFVPPAGFKLLQGNGKVERRLSRSAKQGTSQSWSGPRKNVKCRQGTRPAVLASQGRNEMGNCCFAALLRERERPGSLFCLFF